MAIQIKEMKLFDSPYYSYSSPMFDKTFIWTFTYNTRMKKWVVQLSSSDGTPIVSGLILSADYPHFLDYVNDFNGVLVLSPIGKRDNETISNPYEIFKYYQLLFIYDDLKD